MSQDTILIEETTKEILDDLSSYIMPLKKSFVREKIKYNLFYKLINQVNRKKDLYILKLTREILKNIISIRGVNNKNNICPKYKTIQEFNEEFYKVK